MKRKLLISMLLLSIFCFTNVFADTASCPNGIETACGLPKGLVLMINDFYNLLKIAVPIVLIIVGSLDLFKGITAQKDDEIKKGQKIFCPYIYKVSLNNSFSLIFLLKYLSKSIC